MLKSLRKTDLSITSSQENAPDQRTLKATPPLVFIIFMAIGFLLPTLGIAGKMAGIAIEVVLLLLLADQMLGRNKDHAQFPLYLGVLIGGEIFFRNFVHEDLPGYLIVEYASIAVGILSLLNISIQKKGKLNGQILLWVLFCLYNGFSLVYSKDAYDGRWFLSVFLAGLSIMSISYFFFDARSAIRLLEGTALGVALVFGLLCYYEVTNPTLGRFGHGINSAVQNGIFLTIGLICLVSLTKKSHLVWHRYLIPMVAFSIGALLTFSRGPVIGALIAIFAIALSDNPFGPRVRNLVTTLIVIAFFAAVIYTIAPEQFMSRYIGIEVDEERVGIWQSAIEAWREKPIWGWGVGSWSKVYPLYSWMMINAPGAVSDAHNVFLQILLETGMVGLGIFLLFLLTVLFRVIRRFSLEQLGLFGYVTGVGVVENWKIVIFFVLIAYILVLARDPKSKTA